MVVAKDRRDVDVAAGDVGMGRQDRLGLVERAVPDAGLDERIPRGGLGHSLRLRQPLEKRCRLSKPGAFPPPDVGGHRRFLAEDAFGQVARFGRPAFVH